MGFDVYGKNPVVVEGMVEPEWPEDFGKLSDEDQSDYFKKQDEFRSLNEGNYFRASIWSWRPILDIICQECSHLLDGDTLEGLGCNDGHGPDDQETCTEMAECIEKFVAVAGESEGYSLPSELRVKGDGTLVTGEDADWDKTQSAYSVDWDHLVRFCKFLRKCGGFAAH